MSKSLDIITLRGLSAIGQHGVYDFERSGQVFTADIDLYIDSRRAASTDDVRFTVDYSKIADEAIEVLTGPPVYLIETLAANLLEVVLRHQGVHGAQVTVHKPMAPIQHQFSDVSVTLKRMKSLPGESPATEGIAVKTTEAILSLGANLGQPRDTLRAAVDTLRRTAGLTVMGVSPLVLTEPVLGPGQAAQPPYCNVIVKIATTLTAQQLLVTAQRIEQEYGRTRTEHWGPRTLDIDIIDFGGQTINTDALQLPHPRAATRAFVLYPWSLLEPAATFADGRAVSALAQLATDYAGILAVERNWLQPPAQSAQPAQLAQPAQAAPLAATQAPAQAAPLPPAPPAPTQAPRPTQPRLRENVPVQPVQAAEPARLVESPQPAEPASVAKPVRPVVPPLPKRSRLARTSTTASEGAQSDQSPLFTATQSNVGQPVDIRGNRVALRPLSGDSLFQQLMEREKERERQEILRRAAPAGNVTPTATAARADIPAPTRKRRDSVTAEQPVAASPYISRREYQEQQAAAPQPNVQPVQPAPPVQPMQPVQPVQPVQTTQPVQQPMQSAPYTPPVEPAPASLPQWLPTRQAQVRVVDSFDSEDEDARMGRRTTVRPTPTGAIAIVTDLGDTETARQ